MNDCECKSGFYSLRDCGQPATAQCQVCNRAMCREHAAPQSLYAQCRDCWARQQQQGPDADARGRFRDQDYDDWAYHYRNRHYAEGYAPIYVGTHYHSYYDYYDSRSFHDRNDNADLHGQDDVRAGFGDS